jgi:microcystin degradation protein MlrC
MEMQMKVLVAGYKHETNTFALDKADWAAFEKGETFPPPVRGAAMLATMDTVAMPATGFLRYARAQGWSIVPSLWCGAVPSSYVTAGAYERICNEICEDVKAGGFDAVYLDLHGAGVAENEDDTEGELIRRVREQVGESIPIVVSLDLHANVTEKMLSYADAMVSFRTYPHIDYVETGELTGELLRRRMACGHQEPVCWKRLPFLIPLNSQNTTSGPAKRVYEKLRALDSMHGTMTSFCMAFPAADFAECAPMIWSVGENAASVVEELYACAAEPSQWRLEVLSADQAVHQALSRAAQSRAPVVIADTQDNPGAGGTATTTGMLHALLKARAGEHYPQRVALGVIFDTEFASRAARAGVGARLDGSLGQVTELWDGPTDPPVVGEFIVKAVSDGQVTFKGPKMTGFVADLGPSACVEIGGVLVVVASGKIGTQDRELFRFVGVDPEHLKIVVVKSSNHFRADFVPLVENEQTDVLIAKARGVVAVDPGDLPWRKLSPSIRPRP